MLDPEQKVELEHVTRRMTIKYVNVLWTNQSEREATWELEDQMYKKYPYLFDAGEFYAVCLSSLFATYHRNGRIRGRILLRGRMKRSEIIKRKQQNKLVS